MRQKQNNTEVPTILDQFSLDVPIPVMNAAMPAIEAKDRAVATIDTAYDAILEFQDTLEQLSKFIRMFYDIHDVEHQLPDVYKQFNKIVIDLKKSNIYILNKSSAIIDVTYQINIS